MTFHDSWRTFKEQATLLREITEEELEHIGDFLANMKPDDLPFKELFGDKMRVGIPFDKELLPRRLQDFEKRMNFEQQEDSGAWKIDFKEGTMERYLMSDPANTRGKKRHWQIIPPGARRNLTDKDKEQWKKDGWLFKTEKMKIGKFLTKYIRLKEKAEKARWTSKPGDNEPDWAVAKNAEGELYNFAGSRFASSVGVAHAQEILDTWARSGDKSKPMAIVLSRHPVDVLRMADYKHIQSCHSPKSRGGEGSHYHCAVAEAHGHGAVAYLVNQEELNEISLEAKEIFSDEKRDVEGIEPIARVRIRRYVYPKGKDDVEDPDTYSGDLAVPEQRIYGPEISGFLSDISEWLRTQQEKKLSEFPKFGDNSYDLSRTALIGGTYYDTQPATMFRKWLPPETDMAGSPKIIHDVEEAILSRLNVVTVSAWQPEIEEIQGSYDLEPRYTISAEAMDDGAAGVFIQLTEATMNFVYPLDEFKILPTRAYQEIDTLPQHFEDMGDNTFYNGNTAIAKVGDTVVIRLDISPEHLITSDNGFDVTGYLSDPEEYSELLAMLQNSPQMQRAYREYKEEIATELRRGGILKGGAIFNLAWDAENGEFDRTGWEVVTDDGHMPGHVNASIANLKVPEIPVERGRDFEIELKKEIVALAAQRDKEYIDKDNIHYPNMWLSKLALEFEVTESSSDEQVNVLTAIILKVKPKEVEEIAAQIGQKILSDDSGLNERMHSNWRAWINK